MVEDVVANCTTLKTRYTEEEFAMTTQAAAVRSTSLRDDVPLFTVLERFKACESILLRNNVGRIAFALEDRVSVVPVHYVYEDGWIYGRTASGGKIRDLLRNRRVAFEVDEHTQLLDWQSVVIRGPLYLIDVGTSPAERSTYAKAVALIGGLVPAALADSDPIPFRDQLFRIRAVEISGRKSEPSGGKKNFPRREAEDTFAGRGCRTRLSAVVTDTRAGA